MMLGKKAWKSTFTDEHALGLVGHRAQQPLMIQLTICRCTTVEEDKGRGTMFHNYFRYSFMSTVTVYVWCKGVLLVGVP